MFEYNQYSLIDPLLGQSYPPLTQTRRLGSDMAPTVQTQMPRLVQCGVYALTLQRRFRLQNHSTPLSSWRFPEAKLHSSDHPFGRFAYGLIRKGSGRRHPIRVTPYAKERVVLSAIITRQCEGGRMVTSGQYCMKWTSIRRGPVQRFKLQVVCPRMSR